MKAIVFIGTQKSGSSCEAIKAAEHLGYYTILFTDRQSYLENRMEFPDVHLMQLCNLSDKQELIKALQTLNAKAIKINAIVSFVDPHCHMACMLAEEFGVNHFSTEAVGNMQNKILSRQVLSKSPYVPYYISFSEESPVHRDQLEKNYPLVMKSPDSSGSKDVFKVNSYKEFCNHADKLFQKYPHVPILVEEFLDGPQYLVETLVYKNEINIIAVIQQEINYNKRFIVTGYNLMHEIEDNFYSNLKSAVESIIKAHGMEFGPCHLELRHVKKQWKLIEINPRISGSGMNKMIQIAFGINLVEETLKIALGQEPNLIKRHKNPTFAQHIIVSREGILEKVTGRNKASRCPGVKDVYIRPRKGAHLTPPLSMGNRYAYVIAIGDSEENAKENAKYAASQIQFHLLPVPGKDIIEAAADKKNTDDFLDVNLENFKIYLRLKNISEDTISGYLLLLTEYVKWLRENSENEHCTLCTDDTTKYINHLKVSRQNSSKIINYTLKSLIKYNEYLVSAGIKNSIIIDSNYLIDISYDYNKN